LANKDIDERLRQLGIYSDYYYRLELKPLAKILNFDEKLLCVLTGFHNGSRKMLAVTDWRMIIIGSGVVSGSSGIYIKRKNVKEWKFNKRFLLSSVSFSDGSETYEFRQTQGARKELFESAMNSPVTEFDA